MNKLFELFEAERPVIPDSNADYYIGYNNGLCMAQAIVLKRDVVEVVRCKDCKRRGDYPCPMYYEQLVEQNYGDGCIEYEWAEHDRTLDNGFCSMGERKDNGICEKS